MKEQFKKKVAEIKDGLPKEKWGEAIKATRHEMFPPQPEKIQCSNLGETTPVIKELAEAILKDEKNIIIRYLRLAATVGVKTVTVIDDDDGGCEGSREVKQRTICSGVPFGCMVAFKRDDKLYVGWSIRHTGRVLDKIALAGLFQRTFDAIYLPEHNALMSRPKAEAKKDVLMANFSKELMTFLTGSNINPVEELAFAKRSGKLHAIVRALRDNIGIHGPTTKAYPLGKFVMSEASGPIPKDIAKALQWFIPAAEEVFKVKSTNVGLIDKGTEKSLTAEVNTLPMVVNQTEGE